MKYLFLLFLSFPAYGDTIYWISNNNYRHGITFISDNNYLLTKDAIGSALLITKNCKLKNPKLVLDHNVIGDNVGKLVESGLECRITQVYKLN